MDLDFEKTCRTCLTKNSKDLLPIFKGNAQEILKNCFQIQINENDGLPNKICKKCIKKVEEVLNFGLLCKKSDTTLKETYNQKFKLEEKENIEEEVKEETGNHSNDDDDDDHQNFDEIKLEIFIDDPPVPEEQKKVKGKRKYVRKNPPQSRPKGSSKAIKDYECDLCQGKFPRKFDVLRHFQSRLCPNRIEVKHSRKEEPQFYSCKICMKQFKSKKNLKSHMNVHNDTKPHLCGVCGKVFSALASLRAHEVRHGEPKFKCEFCSKTFFLKHWYEVHKRAHTNERPFQCDKCEKAYTRKDHLQRHEDEFHAGIMPERKYTCEYCFKKFYKQSILDDHIRTHTGERPFSCEVCDTKFTKKSNVLKHRRRFNH